MITDTTATPPRPLYGPADVAAALGVTKPAVTNWNRRGLDIPKPDHVTVDGRAYWNNLTPWHEWHTARAADAARRAAEKVTDAEATAARAARAAERAAARAATAAEHAAELDARAQLAALRARLAAEPDAD